MIPSKQTQYRMRYKQCTRDKNHSGESLNYVCLNSECSENSLICSMCRNDHHQGHLTQPLKYYIDSLKKEYEQESRNFSKEFDSLEESRAIFFLKLRESVQKVAEQFQKLEEEVMERYNLIHSQILEEQSNRNKFIEFYESVIHENDEKTEFLIQNYLPKKLYSPLDNFEPIEKLGEKLTKLVLDARESLLSSHREDAEQPSNSPDLLKLAKGIIKTNNNFSQSDFTYNAPSMNALAVDLKDMKAGKIRIKIVKLKKGGSIHIGAIRKDFFDGLNFKAPQPWNGAQSEGKLHYYNNHATVFGQKSSQLKTFSEGSNMEVTMSGDVMKISMKKNSAEFKLGEGEFYFFFSLAGNAEIEMRYFPSK